MPASLDTFSQWLTQAQITECALTPDQRGLLLAAFHFRQLQGTDYYSTRLLSHVLLHAQSGLKIAQIARLLHLSRPTASRQQRCSAKEAIQQAHHRMDGRPYGKLFPRYAGPIAQFLFAQPEASRADTLDFIDRTFHVRVSPVALTRFLKKFGLDATTRQAALTASLAATAAAVLTPLSPPPPPEVDQSVPAAPTVPAAPLTPPLVLPPGVPVIAKGQPVPTPAPPFSSRTRSSPGPSCCCPRHSIG
ncbi:MAG TPA: hypothetical protein VN648_07675 [Candidatus Methylomirabilis sp.]|nr:hypothetical protein [Candidatus Methylomirabilis sp.]